MRIINILTKATMAKSKSILELQGTINGIAHVNSKTYGHHLRKARSSGAVNEVFKENNLQIVDANAAARLIKNTVDAYRGDFIGGQFWQNLVSCFMKQLKLNIPFNVKALKDIEINENYKLSRIYNENLRASIDEERRMLTILLESTSRPDFKRKFVDGYRISTIAVFPDFTTNYVESMVVESEVISLSLACEPLSFNFYISENADQYLICLKIEAFENARLCSGHATKGMRIVDAGDIWS
ncbi:MAG: hypothetical protein ACO1N7_13220 [Sphingobacteriaceae bacterium]